MVEVGCPLAFSYVLFLEASQKTDFSALRGCKQRERAGAFLRRPGEFMSMQSHLSPFVTQQAGSDRS